RVAAMAPPHAIALVGELAERVGVRAPRLVVGDGASGPHVVGVVRATIVLPPALLADQVLLRAALLHELAHVRRRDSLARVVQLVASALLFWWPVVRFAHRRLELAREAACDAVALDHGDVSRVAYARLLVQMAGLAHVAAPQLAAPHALDARVAAVLGPPARGRIGAVHRLALAAWALLCLGGARSAAARGEVCHYTPQLAEALYLAHPEADLDGDGLLSRDEACELQAELRRQADQLASFLDPQAEVEVEPLLAEPLCCNCTRAGAYSSLDAASCHSVEGADR
ncbi:MAG: M56 family metallopeptidase, partial [Acidobacteriota bacterium]